MDLSIYNTIKPDDNTAMSMFLMDNSISHSLHAVAMEQQGIGISVYPIDKMGKKELWLHNHNNMHQQEFTNLGLTGLPDLGEVDMGNSKDFFEWMQAHSLAHQTVDSALGITP